jgi:hypothetical protein
VKKKTNQLKLTTTLSGKQVFVFATCAYSIKARKNLYYRGKLSFAEQNFSSGHRELLAVRQTLDYSRELKENLEPTNVY